MPNFVTCKPENAGSIFIFDCRTLGIVETDVMRLYVFVGEAEGGNKKSQQRVDCLTYKYCKPCDLNPVHIHSKGILNFE